MANDFDCFVVLAEMRTGSNFLETNLNALDGVSCHGEAFNPYFVGYPNQPELLGITQAMREQNPDQLFDAIRNQGGVIGGFRYFHDHDPRIQDRVLNDPRCAKIILTRNPIESYVSWKIAQATGQWKLTNVKRRKEARADFDAVEFGAFVDALQGFQVKILNALQRTGQTAFYVAYEDLQSLEVINGLATWLGVSSRLETLDDSLKPQNPGSVASKVSNPEVMQLALADLDRFNLNRTPNFEPRRGAGVRGYYGGKRSPLLFMPIPGGPTLEVLEWMAALENLIPEQLFSDLNQKQLRAWKEGHPGFRSFTVLRHPVARCHDVFCKQFLLAGRGTKQQIRKVLKEQFGLKLPDAGVSLGVDDHMAAFKQFLRFVKANLAGQTSVRVDSTWASQSQILSGFAEMSVPDMILREEEMKEELPRLATRVGMEHTEVIAAFDQFEPTVQLADVYDDQIENLCRNIYKRDYTGFGFMDWG